MLKLTEFATPREIRALIRSRITRELTADETKDVLEKVKKTYIYQKRRMSHIYKTRDPKFELADFDSLLWKFYLAQEIEQGRTTGDIAEELGLDLAEVNKRI